MNHSGGVEYNNVDLLITILLHLCLFISIYIFVYYTVHPLIDMHMDICKYYVYIFIHACISVYEFMFFSNIDK